MFLGILNNEEKKMFLDMAIYVSKANGLVEESESALIKQYCKEMDVESYSMTTPQSVDEIKTFFLNSNEASKRVVTLELLGLGYMDGDFDDVEDSVVRDFALGIGLSEEIYLRLKRDIEEYTTILGIIQTDVLI